MLVERAISVGQVWALSTYMHIHAHRPTALNNNGFPDLVPVPPDLVACIGLSSLVMLSMIWLSVTYST